MTMLSNKSMFYFLCSLFPKEKRHSVRRGLSLKSIITSNDVPVYPTKLNISKKMSPLLRSGLALLALLTGLCLSFVYLNMMLV